MVLGNFLSTCQEIGLIQAAYAFGSRYARFDRDYRRTAAQDPQRMAIFAPRYHLLGNLEYNAGIRVGILFQ